jgi:hypothetical protein
MPTLRIGQFEVKDWILTASAKREMSRAARDATRLICAHKINRHDRVLGGVTSALTRPSSVRQRTESATNQTRKRSCYGSVMIRPVLSVATWNLKFNSAPDRTLSYLRHARWDIACLQEVSGSASRVLERHEDWTVVDGLKLASQEFSSWKRPHATAIVARNRWSLENPEVVADTPTPGRGVKAVARRDGDVVSVISWHAPNAAGEGVETKMAGYRAVVTAIGATAGSLVVGLDSNHWSLSADLDLVDHDPESPFAFENQFFSGHPQHRLRDALNVYLRENPDVPKADRPSTKRPARGYLQAGPQVRPI